MTLQDHIPVIIIKMSLYPISKLQKKKNEMDLDNILLTRNSNKTNIRL